MPHSFGCEIRNSLSKTWRPCLSAFIASDRARVTSLKSEVPVLPWPGSSRVVGSYLGVTWLVGYESGSAGCGLYT